MNAAPADQERLLELQDLDNRLQRLDRLEQELPERGALHAVVAARAAGRADQNVAAGELDDARTELRRIESDVSSIEQRIAQDEGRMMSASSAKDATGFEHELESLRRRLSEREDAELEAMERVEALEATAAELETSIAELDAEVAAAEEGVQVALESIAAERGATTAARGELVAALPAELVALYDRQRARYGVGASRLRRGVSEASGMALTGDELAKVRAAAADAVVLCPQSEAILVRTAESGI